MKCSSTVVYCGIKRKDKNHKFCEKCGTQYYDEFIAKIKFNVPSEVSKSKSKIDINSSYNLNMVYYNKVVELSTDLTIRNPNFINPGSITQFFLDAKFVYEIDDMVMKKQFASVYATVMNYIKLLRYHNKNLDEVSNTILRLYWEKYLKKVDKVKSIGEDHNARSIKNLERIDKLVKLRSSSNKIKLSDFAALLEFKKSDLINWIITLPNNDFISIEGEYVIFQSDIEMHIDELIAQFEFLEITKTGKKS